MKRPLLWKALFIGAMALALLVPLAMIEGQIAARSRRQKEVIDNIAATAAGRQQLAGPFLVVEWQQRVERETRKDDGTVLRTQTWEDRRQVVPPSTLRLDGSIDVEERHRGLYKARIFHLAGTLKGTFAVPRLPASDGSVRQARAKVALGITDLRGVQNKPGLRWGGAGIAFASGTGMGAPAQGIHADLGPAADLAPGETPFEIPLELLGSQAFSMAPVAEETQVTLKSAWPDPSFGGRFLPVRRQVGERGFEAEWKVPALARNLGDILQNHGREGTAEAFEVAFVEPVNVYLQAERAVKYGLLFVGLTFAAFFLFEVVGRLRIHPMNYLLVGLALALFFLLLISLSEHLPFLAAYLAASGASILLLSGYLAHVLGSRARGVGFGAGLTLLHAVLYGLLASEDNALLMGSVLLFAALGAVMAATRKVDWYALGAQDGENRPA